MIIEQVVDSDLNSMLTAVGIYHYSDTSWHETILSNVIIK